MEAPSTQAVEGSVALAEADELFPGECWGRLVSLAAEHHDVLLCNSEETLGRHSSCSVVFTSQHLSMRHCSVARRDNVVMVTDLSTNGTFLNGTLIGKNKSALLSNLDELSLLMPHNKNIASIRYVFKERASDAAAHALGPLQEYQVRGVLGAGAYATVRLGVHKATGQQVAIKMIEKKKMVGGSSRADAVHDEVSTLERVAHPHIIRILGHCENDTTVYLILELVTGGELFDYVVKWPDGLPERAARTIFTQIIDAVAYLHRMGISHRDLKPENILLAETPLTEDGPFNVKLSDFGLSRLVNDGAAMSTMCGTPTYLAPEVLSKKQYDHKVDIWSMGVILFILLSGKPPFEDLQHISVARYTFDDAPWSHVSREAKDLIARMLVVEPAQRLRADDVQQHAWIVGIALPPPAPVLAVAEEFVAPAPVVKKAKSGGDSSAPDREPCRYGKACYRKNPKHLEQFSHD